jgi:hypothetical protein
VAAGDRTDKLVSMVRARVNEPSEQGFDDDEILAALNEGQQDLCVQLDDAALYAIQEKQNAALTLDTNPYALPADFMRARVLEYKSTVARRWQVHRLDALASDGDTYSQPSETNPAWYLWDNQLYIEAGTKTSGNYHLYYYKVPTDMTTGVDPLIPAEYDGLLVGFAITRIREKQGGPMWDEGERLWQEYIGRCAIINSRYSGRLPFDGTAGDRRAG